MSWTYKQSTGELLDPTGQHIANGYAGGNCGKNPEGKNNKLLQAVKSVGPIPVGKYTLGEVVLTSHLGPYAIPLIPYHDNKMFGRGGFYMHGDTTPSGNASEGCIIMPRIVRVRVYGSDDRTIEVV